MSENKYIYVVVLIEEHRQPVDSKRSTVWSMEPVGVYSDAKAAFMWQNKLDDLLPSIEKDWRVFDILEFELDKDPIILTFMEKVKLNLEDQTTMAIKDLMDKGIVDQLIGEDGHFYYTLTDDGKKLTKKIPKMIRDMFKKK